MQQRLVKIDADTPSASRLAQVREQVVRRIRALRESSTLTENAAISRHAFWIPTSAALLLALAVRLVVLVRSAGMMDGDEAVLGIQAERILHGMFPIYFAGQPYMGSWDAYLLAPVIAIFGPSAWAVHAITLAESLILVPLMGALALRLYGRGALIPALLLTALPPLYTVVTQLRMLGGYVETLDLGVGLMLVMTMIAQRWETGQQTAWLWGVAGFLVGLGIWIDPLVVYFVIACALWIAPLAWSCFATREGIWSAVPSGMSPSKRHLGPAILGGGACVVAMLLGAAPAVYYAVTHQLANLVVLNRHGSLSHVNPFRLGTLRYFFVEAIPTIVGARFPYPFLRPETLLAIALRGVALVIACSALIYTIVRLVAPSVYPRLTHAWRTRLRPLATPPIQRWNETFPLILIAIVLLIFWRSGATNIPHGLDVDLDRYALPLVISLILLIARPFGDLNSLRPNTERQYQPPKFHRAGFWVKAMLVFALAIYVAPYALTNEVAAMESPYDPGGVFPASDANMLTYLDSHHIHDVWVNHWTGNVIMYLSNQQILCADYVDQEILHGQRRFPEVYAQVNTADKPSYIVTSKPSDGEPLTERALDNLGVTYTSARFGNYVVITSLSQTVHPDEIAWALKDNYYNNA